MYSKIKKKKKMCVKLKLHNINWVISDSQFLYQIR